MYSKNSLRNNNQKLTVKQKNEDYKSEVQVKYLKNNDNQVISLKAEYEVIKTLAIALESKVIEIPLSKLKTIIRSRSI